MNINSIKDKIISSFRTKRFRGGAYAAAITLGAIALVLLINLVFNKLDYTFDLTEDGKYTITEDTKEMLGNMTDKITVYYLKQANSSLAIFERIFEQFERYGKNIKIVEKDPVLNPRFAAQYTDKEISEFSIVVVNETTGQAKYVDYYDMLEMEYTYNSTNYSYDSQVIGVDVEGQLNSAIAYVAGTNFPVVYELTGHGETALGDTAKNLMEKSYISLNSLKLLTAGAIPEDCAMLCINLPATDYTADEAKLIREYLSAGGSLLINLRYDNYGYTNLMSIVKDFGIEMTNGMVLEGNSENYVYSINYLIPTIYNNDFTAGVFQKANILMANSAGLLKSSDVSESITQKILFSTSSSSYVKADGNNDPTKKETGDAEGPFYLGIYANNADTGAQVMAFASMGLFDESYLSEEAFGNYKIFSKTVKELSHLDADVVIVPTVSVLDSEYLILTEQQALSTGIIFMVLIPIFCIAMGIYAIVVRRRK